MGLVHPGQQVFFPDAFLPGADHDGRPVGVVRTNIYASPTPQLLKPNPDIRLDVFDQMP